MDAVYHLTFTDWTMSHRKGLSLIELLVVIGIFASLIALLLPAIQNVRRSAAQARGMNQMRQLVIALHHAAQDRDGYMGGVISVDHWPYSSRSETTTAAPLMYSATYMNDPGTDDIFSRTVPIRSLLSSNDPTSYEWQIVTDESLRHPGSYSIYYPTSYAWNINAFVGPPKLNGSYFSDGTSYTILYAERYYLAKRSLEGEQNRTEFLPEYLYPLHEANSPVGSRRATFADSSWKDVVPITSRNPAVSRPSIPGVTFQLRPTVEEADSRMLQTPYSAGLLVGMADGSVRMIAPGVGETVFWAAVTPCGGEVGTLD